MGSALVASMKTALTFATLIVATALTAPVLAQTDDARSFTIGDFQAMALRDGTISLPNDNKVFGVGHTPAEVAGLLQAAKLPADHLELSLQPLLVKTADRVMLFANRLLGVNGDEVEDDRQRFVLANHPRDEPFVADRWIIDLRDVLPGLVIVGGPIGRHTFARRIGRH